MSNLFAIRYTTTKNIRLDQSSSGGRAKIQNSERRERVARIRKYPWELRVALETEVLEDDVFEEPAEKVVDAGKTDNKTGLGTFKMPKYITFLTANAPAATKPAVQASLTPPTIPIMNSSITVFNFEEQPSQVDLQLLISKSLQSLCINDPESVRQRQIKRDRAFRALRCGSGGSD